MALIDRIKSDGPDKLPVHQFRAGLRGWSRGSISRSTFIEKLGLTADDEPGIDAIKDIIDSKLTLAGKTDYILWVEDVALLLEQGLVSDAQAKALLEIT